MFIWSLGYFILFVSPIFYILYGGEAYNFYNTYGLINYYISSILFGLSLLFSFLINRALILKKERSIIKNENMKLPFMLKTYHNIIFILVAFYILFYFYQLPLYSAIKGNSFVRPDTINDGIKYFFTFSCLMDIVFPSLFLLFSYNRKKKTYSILFFVITCIFLIAGGSKGTLIYFFLFIWFAILKFKISKEFLIFLFLSFFIYFFLKNISLESIEELFLQIQSPIRRFFVTQGIAIPIRFEMQHNHLLDDINYQDIKFVVFEHVYGYSPGSMPIIFFPDMIIIYGWTISTIVLFFFMIILAYVSYLVDRSRSIFLHWNFYIFSYTIIMSGFSEANLYRTILIILNVTIVYLVIRLNKFNKKI